MPRGWNRGGHTTVEENAPVEAPTFQEPTFPVEVTPVAETSTYEENEDVARAKTTYDEAPAVEAQNIDASLEGTYPQPQPEIAEIETAEQVTERKRAPRPAINVGHVVVRKSQRTDFTTRSTPTKSNPVFKAVEAAELDTPTDILVENDERKIKGAISILRRAGAQLNVGMHIAPKDADGYPTEDVESLDADDNTVTTTYAVLTFKTSAERQVRGKKDADTPDVAAAE